MSFKEKLKTNPLVRSAISLYREYFGLRRKKFGYIGEKVVIIPPVNIDNPSNVYLYGNNKIEHCTISATLAKFVMKKGAGSAEGLSVHTGNHMRVPGKYYRDITNADKKASGKVLDKDVIVEEDVWLGCNVTLLSGVTIGRGSTVGAGSVCVKNVPPYAIVMGNPAKVVGFNFTPEQVIEHEKILYPEDERLSLDLLQRNYKKYIIDRAVEIRAFLK